MGRGGLRAAFKALEPLRARPAWVELAAWHDSRKRSVEGGLRVPPIPPRLRLGFGWTYNLGLRHRAVQLGLLTLGIDRLLREAAPVNEAAPPG